VSRFLRLLAAWLLVLSTAEFLLAANTVVIDSVTINNQTNQITVRGSGFDPAGRAPTVTFNTSTLAIVSFTNTCVVANLPTGTKAGGYQLTIKNSTAASSTFDVAYGAIGPQGPAGPEGPAGPQGATGPAGAQGPPGAAGAQGPAGPAGQTGPTGPPVAFQGDWQQPNSYNVGDAVFYNGSSYISLVANNTGNEPNNSPTQWALLAQQGATGAQGPQGLTGAMGPQGGVGPAGPQGPTGDAGPQGPAGPMGATGPAGPQGAQGVAGATGAIGPQGPGVFARGPWQSGGGYALNDVVSDQGQTYRCAYPQGAINNTFNFYYSAAGIYGSGSFATTPQGNNTYLITAINGGQMNGYPLTLLPPNYLPLTQTDNILSTLYPYFDSEGMEYLAGSSYGGLFGLNGVAYFCTPGYGHCPPTTIPIVLTVTPVPQVCAQEPTASNLLPNGEWELVAASGAIGPQGPVGLTGATGAQGAQGPQGAVGPQGPGGAAGPPGPQGPQGPAGPAGQTGLQGPPLVFQGNWQSSNSYNLGDAVFYNGSSYISLVGGNTGNGPDNSPTEWALLAQQGATGVPGAQGLTGAMGPQGATGPPGPAGATGSQGPQGATGATGPEGPSGPTGPQGAEGPQGPAGPSGVGLREYRAALLQWYPTTFGVGASPAGIAFDGTNIWVANEGGNSVSKLLASTGSVVGTYPVGADPIAITFDGGNIWVANLGSDTVTKLLASTGAAIGTYPVGPEPQNIVFDGTNIWITNFGSNSVTKLLASTGAMIGIYSVGFAPEGVAFDGTNIWVANAGSSTVTELLASTGGTVGTFSVGTSPDGIAFDGTNIWVTNAGSGTLTKLLASNGSVVGTYGIGSDPIAVAFDGTNIWVAAYLGGTVTKLSASTGSVIGTYSVGGDPWGVAYDGASIWVANNSGNSVTRIPAL